MAIVFLYVFLRAKSYAFFFCSARRWGKAVAVQGTSARSKARKRTGNRAKIERKSPKIDRKAPQLAPGGPRGDLERFGGLRGCSRDAPGDTREALGAPPDRLGTPPEDPGTSRSDQKVRPGNPEATFLSVLFGQSPTRLRDAPGAISGRFRVAPRPVSLHRRSVL